MKSLIYLLSVLCAIASVSVFAEAGKSDFKQESDWVYVLKKNESFGFIYKSFLDKRVKIANLAKYNQLKLKKALHPGQAIHIPLRMLRKIPVTAEVLLATGDVNVTKATGNEKRVANKGDLLEQGDALDTGKNSLAKLLFADGSNVDIESNSSSKVQESFKYAGKETYVILIKLLKGRAAVEANPDHVTGNALQVETPSAIAAVRGTKFRVGVDSESTTQETLEGEVDFSASGQDVLLPSGFGSAAEKGKPPLPPTVLPNLPDLAGVATNVNEVPVVLNLKPQADALSWATTLAKDSEFTQILDQQVVLAKNAQWKVDDLPNGKYYLKVRATDKNGLQSVGAVHVFEVTARPFAPQLQAPANDTEITLPPTVFAWDGVDYKGAYLFQIARDAAFKDVIVEKSMLENHLSLNQAFGSGQYYWRVGVLEENKVANKKVSSEEYKKFSKIGIFTRAMPKLKAPKDNEALTTLPMQFSWEATHTGGVYVLQIAHDAEFTQMILEQQSPDTHYDVNLTFGSGEYYWRIGILDNGKAKQFSKARKFTR